MSENPPKPAPSNAAGAAAAVDAGPAEHVVLLPALRVAEDLVGLVDLLEPLLRLGVRVDVRVPLLGELAERALDRGIVGAALDAEHLVVVAFSFRGHGTTSVREVRRGAGQAGGSPASSRARARTCWSIGWVSLPVNVFCWLGW